MTVLVTNCIPVNQAHAIDFEDRFVHRINHVDEAPGFIRNEVLRPDPRQFDHASGTWKEEAGEGGAVYRIATLWETMEHFIDWTKSPSFALAHAQKTPRDMFTHAPALDVHEVYLTTEDEEGQAERPPQRGVLVTNCIPVNQAHAIDFEDRFAKRIHHVDEAPQRSTPAVATAVRPRERHVEGERRRRGVQNRDAVGDDAALHRLDGVSLFLAGPRAEDPCRHVLGPCGAGDPRRVPRLRRREDGAERAL